MTLSKRADRRTLIRRLYFDLVGLPPPPDEVDHFLNDTDSRAYEALVDRLVAPGRGSTLGYTDPKYPVTGRVPVGA